MYINKQLNVKFLGFFLLTFLLCQVGYSQSKDANINSKKALPSGDWSLSYHPYQGEDNAGIPVTIYSTISNGLVLSSFRIKNISVKPVKSIKVRWVVYDNQNRKRPLLQGQTKLLSFVNPLPAGESGTINFEVISLSDFQDQFIVKGKLNKSFFVDILVDEVQYADGSAWLLQEGLSKDINKQSWQKVSFFDCAKQYCKGSESKEVKGGVTYSCAASQLNEFCRNVNNETCENVSCNQS
ncbi:MAG: hypothetical protein ACR2MD_13255 [Aridibacter sp.]